MKKKKLIIVTLFSLIIVTSILTLIKVSASDALPYWGCAEQGENRTWCKDYSDGNFLFNKDLPSGPIFIRNDGTTDEKWLGPYRYPTIYQGRFGSGAETTDNTPFDVAGVGQIRAYAGQPFYHLIAYETPVTMTDYPFLNSAARNVIETYRLTEDTVRKRYGGNPDWVLPNLEFYEITKKTKNTDYGSSYGEFYWIQDIAQLSGGYAQNVNDPSFDVINGTRLIMVRTSWPDIITFSSPTTPKQVNSPITFNIKGYEYVSLNRNRVTWDLQVTKDGVTVATKTGTLYSTKGIKNPTKANEYEAGYFDDNSIQWTPTEAGTYSATITINDQVRRNATKTTSFTVKSVGVEQLEITPSSASILKGTTQQYRAIYTNTSGVETDVTADITNTSWSTSSTSIATIGSKTGLATGVNTGNTSVKVTYKLLQANADISVYNVPPPPPEPENLPPTVNISAPLEIKAGDPFCISADASDLDGTVEIYSWNTPSLIGSVEDFATCGVYYLDEGTYPVTVTVTDDKGATGEDTVYINVKPPTPVASMSVGGFLKENRKVNIDSFSSSPVHFPIDWNKSYFIVEPLDGQAINLVKSRATNVTVSGNQYKISYAKNIESLFKLKGRYQVTHYVENTKGLSDTTTQTVTINEDLKPNADFSAVTTIYRDDLTKSKAEATLRVTDSSYSSDDNIQQRIWTYIFDANNNGKFDDDSVITISSVNETYVTVPVNKVGKYKVELTVVENFGQPTLAEFITAADYRKDDTSDKVVSSKIIEVKNLAPVAGYDVNKRKTVKLYIGMGDTNYSQANLETELNLTLRPMLNENVTNLEYEFVVGNQVKPNNNDFYFENSPDMSSYKKGLYRYNWSNKTFYFIEEYATDVKVSPSNIVYHKKLFDSSNTLYFYEPATGLKGSTGLTNVGTYIPSIKNKIYYAKNASGYSTEILEYDLTTKLSTKISDSNHFSSPIKPDLTIDPQGNLYFRHNGIHRYDASTKQVTSLSSIFPDQYAIGGFAAHPDGALYIGYNHTGIYKYDPKTNTKTLVYYIDSGSAVFGKMSISDTGEIYYTQSENLYRFYSYTAGTYLMFRPINIGTFTNGRILATHWNVDTADTRQTFLYSPIGGISTINGQFESGQVVNDGYELQVQSSQYPIVWESGNRLEQLFSLEKDTEDAFYVDISNSANDKLNSSTFVQDLVKQTTDMPFIFLGSSSNQTQSESVLSLKGDGTFIHNTPLGVAISNMSDYIVSEVTKKKTIDLQVSLGNSPYTKEQVEAKFNELLKPKLSSEKIKYNVNFGKTTIAETGSTPPTPTELGDWEVVGTFGSEHSVTFEDGYLYVGANDSTTYGPDQSIWINGVHSGYLMTDIRSSPSYSTLGTGFYNGTYQVTTGYYGWVKIRRIPVEGQNWTNAGTYTNGDKIDFDPNYVYKARLSRPIADSRIDTIKIDDVSIDAFVQSYSAAMPEAILGVLQGKRTLNTTTNTSVTLYKIKRKVKTQHVMLTPVEDVYLDYYNATTNRNGWRTLKIGYFDGYKALYKFDVSSLQGKTVKSAYVELVPSYSETVSPFGLKEVTSAWDAKTVTFNTKPTYGTNVITSTSYSDTKRRIHKFDITNLVNDWTKGVKPNNGFVVMTNDSATYVGAEFLQSETGYGAKLVVDYETINIQDANNDAFAVVLENNALTSSGEAHLTNELKTKDSTLIGLGTVNNQTQFENVITNVGSGKFINNTNIDDAVQQMADYIIEKVNMSVMEVDLTFGVGKTNIGSLEQIQTKINDIVIPKLNSSGIKVNKMNVTSVVVGTGIPNETVGSELLGGTYGTSSTPPGRSTTARYTHNMYTITAKKKIMITNPALPTYGYDIPYLGEPVSNIPNGTILLPGQSVNVTLTYNPADNASNYGGTEYITSKVFENGDVKLTPLSNDIAAYLRYKVYDGATTSFSLPDSSKPHFATIIEDFTLRNDAKDMIVGENLAKNSYLIGLGTTDNQIEFENLVKSNMEKGTFINNSNIDIALNNYADYIIQETQKRSNINDIYLTLEESAEYFTYYEDAEKDPKYADRWRYDQKPSIFENDMGFESFNLINLDLPVKQFSKVGRFQTFYAARDNPIWWNDEKFDNYRLWSNDADNWYIYVHRKPIPNFQFTINSTTGDYTISNTSYDLDKYSINIGNGPGLQSFKWNWREKGQTTWQEGLPISPLARKEYEVKITIKDFQNREENLVRILDGSGINKAPIADFEPIPAKGYIDEPISYKNNSYDPNGDALTYEWSWKLSTDTTWLNGTPTLATEATKEPNTKFSSKGIFDVRLRVKDSLNSYSTYVIKQVTIQNRAPKAAFTYAPTTIYNNTNVSFTNLSSDPDNDVLTHKWDYMSPGSTVWTTFSSVQTPTARTFNIKGDWRIRLTVSDGTETVDTEQVLVVDNRPPVANFNYSPTTNLYRGTSITLTDTSTDPDGSADIIRHLWEVQYAGDTTWTSIGTTLNSSLIPTKVGNLNVRKTVEDSSGQVSSIIKTLTISNRTPSVVISYVPSSNLDTETMIDFKATGNDPDTGDIPLLTYKWYFKGPNNADFVEYFYTDTEIQRRLSVVGSWQVKVVVTDPYGATGQDVKTINVVDANKPPVAAFIYSPSTIYRDTTVQFTNQSTDPDMQTLTYQWFYQPPNSSTWTSFSTATHPSRILNQLGTWKIRLIATDTSGATNEAIKDVPVINRPPIAGFTTDKTNYNLGEVITVTSTASDEDNDVLTYNYQITSPTGVKTTKTTANFTLTSSEEGIYTIIQTVTDGNGGTSSISKTVAVYSLIIIGKVEHTPDWDAIRIQKGNQPLEFYSGEKFILKADISNQPVEYVKVKINGELINGTLINDEVTLTRSSSILYTGEYFKDAFANPRTFIKKSPPPFTFNFEVKYSNGVIKNSVVNVTIIGDVYDVMNLHQIF